MWNNFYDWHNFPIAKTNLNQRNPSQEYQQPKSPDRPPQATDRCISILNRSWIIRYCELHKHTIWKFFENNNASCLCRTCQSHEGEPQGWSCSALMASQHYSWYSFLRSWPALTTIWEWVGHIHSSYFLENRYIKVIMKKDL